VTTRGHQNWCRHLRETYDLEVLSDGLSEADLRDVDVLVFCAPQDKFSEVDILKNFICNGGSVLILFDQCNEGFAGNNTNQLTEIFGIKINDDHVICTSNQGSRHPKETLVSWGMPNNTGDQFTDRTRCEENSQKEEEAHGKFGDENIHAQHSAGITLNVPLATTLTVKKPAISILSTGRSAYPFQHSLGAVWPDFARDEKMGRLAVLGCAGIAADEFLDCAGNLEFLDIVLKWLSPSSAFNIHALRADMPESIESRILSDMRGLAGRTRSCLQEIDELPKEFDVLFERSQFRLLNELGKEAGRLHAALSLKYAALDLINPKFLVPMARLQPSTFLSSLRDLKPPYAELFDLEDECASEKFRLGTILKQTLSTDDILESLVAGCVRVSGTNIDNLKSGHVGRKGGINQIFRHVVRLKGTKLGTDRDDPLCNVY